MRDRFWDERRCIEAVLLCECGSRRLLLCVQPAAPELVVDAFQLAHKRGGIAQRRLQEAGKRGPAAVGGSVGA